MSLIIKPEIGQIISAMQDAGVPDINARIIAAQAIHESANFTSNVYKSNNNAYGMKMPNVRKSPYIIAAGTNAPGSEGGGNYAKYASVKDSALDALHLYHYNKVNWSLVPTVETFIDWLKSKNYFQGDLSNYKAAVNNYLEQIKGLNGDVLLQSKKKAKFLHSILIALAVLLPFGFIVLWIIRLLYKNNKRYARRKY